MVESNIENTKKSTSILSNPHFSKKSMPASILIYSHLVMPYPSALKTFFFKSSNITNFFNWYSQMCTNYQVNKQEKIKNSYSTMKY